jgi:hypothetical protein
VNRETKETHNRRNIFGDLRRHQGMIRFNGDADRSEFSREVARVTPRFGIQKARVQ